MPDKETSGCLDQEPLSMVLDDSTEAKKLREVTDRLLKSDLGRWIELPSLAVLGDTSSGKSSLLSQISGIELPSSHQLTTKCPILLQMRQTSGDMKAMIGVQWQSSSVKEEYPTFATKICSYENWKDIPKKIQEAQANILEHSRAAVAAHLVTVQVEGPHVADLTLLDLPGWIRTHADEESASIVAQVQQLIQQHLHNPRCVILAVIPANVDFHNAQILADARQVDPTTSRTLPIITKPDLIDPGAESDVLSLLRNQTIRFEQGFHLIKSRGQAALDKQQAIDDAIQEEAMYFSTTAPWSMIEDRSLLGTPALRRKLAALQLTMIRQSIPSILQEIQAKRQLCMEQLQQMGDLPLTASQRRRVYQDITQSLVQQLSASLSGKRSKSKSAAAALHDACGQFMESIQRGSLGTIRSMVEGALVLVTSPRGVTRGEIVYLDTDFCCVDFVEEADAASEALFEAVGLSTVEAVEENTVWADGNLICIARSANTYDTMKKIPLHCVRTDPSWLKDKIAENRTDDLACFLNVDTFKSIVEEFIEEDWKPHCMHLLQSTKRTLEATVSATIAETCPVERWPQLRLLVERVCHKAMSTLMEDAKRQLHNHLEMEKHPFTQDGSLFENISDARARNLKQELEISLRLDQDVVLDAQAIKGIMDGVFERQRLKSVEDHAAEEMEIVLESYGKVATRRVIDRTPMICWEVFRTLSSSIQESLWSVTDDMLAQCLQETPDFTRRHADFTEELQEMVKALRIFESVLV